MTGPPRWTERIGQGVLHHQAHARGPFQQGHLDVGSVQGFDHGRPRHSDHLRRDHEGQGDDRHRVDADHVGKCVDLICERQRRKPFQVNGEQQHR